MVCENLKLFKAAAVAMQVAATVMITIATTATVI